MSGNGSNIIGIVKHYGRVFAAALQYHFFEIGLRRIVQEATAGCRGAGKAHHIDIRMQTYRLAHLFPDTGDDIQHACWNTGLDCQLRHAQRGQ